MRAVLHFGNSNLLVSRTTRRCTLQARTRLVPLESIGQFSPMKKPAVAVSRLSLDHNAKDTASRRTPLVVLWRSVCCNPKASPQLIRPSLGRFVFPIHARIDVGATRVSAQKCLYV